MKKNIILMLSIMNTSAFAGTIEWNVARDDYFGDLTILTKLLPGWNSLTNMFFYKEYDDSGSVIITPFGIQLTPGTAWRQMDYGDWVDASSTASIFTDFFVKPASPPFDKKLEIQNGESVYLGFVFFDVGEVVPGVGYDVYGWVELTNKDGVISIGFSAIDIDGDRIRIWVIPEPSTSLLALSGLALLFRRRRR